MDLVDMKKEHVSSPIHSSPVHSSLALPDTVNPASRVLHYTPKAAIFDFYTDVKMIVEPNGHEVVIGKCATCSQTIRGSRNVTSNFVTHVKRLHPERQSDWERKKAERHGYFTKNYTSGSNLSSFSNLYSTFTIPTQVKLQTTPSTMLCYDAHNITQPSVTSCYGNAIVTQDNYMVTQDATLTTTVKQEKEDKMCSKLYLPSLTTHNTPVHHTDFQMSRVGVVSPDSVTDNEMWALLQAKQMLLFLVEQFLPLETADSPSLTTLLSRAPQKPYSSTVLQNVLVPTCVSHVTTSITCSLQDISSVNIVVTTQRKKWNSILFAVSLHFVDSSWRQKSYLLSLKYHSSVQQFECSFLDILVKHAIENKVFSVIGTDMTQNSNFSLLEVPELAVPVEPVLLPDTLAGIKVQKCDPLPDVTNTMILSSLTRAALLTQLRDELKASKQNFEIRYDIDIPKWSCEQSQISTELPTLSDILSTLEPFKEIFDLLKSNQLLISVAIPSILSLIKLLEQKPSSSLTAGLLKQLTLYLDKLNSISYYRAAAFLDPRFKLVWCKDKEEEANVVTEVRLLCQDKLNNQENETAEMKVKQESDLQQPESKRIKLFTYFSSSSPDNLEPARSFTPLDREIREYIQLSVSEETTNPLEYWRDNSSAFRQLSRAAAKLLAIPIVQTKVQSHLSKFEKRIESLEDVSLGQTQEYLYLKVNNTLW